MMRPTTNLLLQKLKDVREDKRSARFAVSIAFVGQDGTVLTSDGQAEGRILFEPAGVNGFGYDPLFYTEVYGKSFAQLTPQQKNEISHRGKALRAMRKLVEKRYGPIKCASVSYLTHTVRRRRIRPRLWLWAKSILLCTRATMWADAHIMAKRTGILTYAVSGNCDYTGDDEIVLTLCGSRVLMVHGHDHSIKRSLDKLASYVEQREANVCIFGHSHVPLTQKNRPVFVYQSGQSVPPEAGHPHLRGVNASKRKTAVRRDYFDTSKLK